jgi:dihydrofolate synthase/folylpolyglutamate synthase
VRDFATSDSPKVQAQLDRLAALSQPQGRIGIEAIRVLLERLGNPQERLPPVFHVAGTNGKGSTCAFLRAMLEAEGLRVHATISPHLVRYNERIRIAGKLIEDTLLAELLREVLDTAQGLEVSFFETTIAAAFLAFARHPADACVVEVGLGGRFDATNVIARPAVCGIASLGIDHERFLLAPEDGTPTEPLARIAFEKAGIAKPGVPLVTQFYPPEATREIIAAARRAGAPLAMRGDAWSCSADMRLTYRDSACMLSLPLPALPGAHQVDNAALAVAMIQHQQALTIGPMAMTLGLKGARWPARLQRLGPGPLSTLAPDRTLWLDGGHNPDAGEAIARHFAGQRLHLIVGMLANKDPCAIVEPLGERIASLQVVPVPGHEHHDAAAFGPDAKAMPDVASALAALPGDNLPVLICGSLYLAGEVLHLNEELPD